MSGDTEIGVPSTVLDGIVRVPTADGEVMLTRDHDMVHLRAWLIRNTLVTDPTTGDVLRVQILPHLTQPLITVPIPSQNIVFTMRQIEIMANAVLQSVMLADEFARAGVADIPADYPGQPLRAATNIDGVDYVQDAAEPTTAFEQRVINDMMIRRGRELMTSHDLTAEQAAAAVQRMLDDAGITGLASPSTRPQAPAPATARALSGLTGEEERILADGINSWGDNVPLRADLAAIMHRIGMTSANMVWFREQSSIVGANLPASVLEPTDMEAWRD